MKVTHELKQLSFVVIIFVYDCIPLIVFHFVNIYLYSLLFSESVLEMCTDPVIVASRHFLA